VNYKFNLSKTGTFASALYFISIGIQHISETTHMLSFSYHVILTCERLFESEPHALICSECSFSSVETMGRNFLVGRCSSIKIVLSQNGTGSVLRFSLSLGNLDFFPSDGSKGNCKSWIASLMTLHVDEYFRAGGLGGESNSCGIESDSGLLFGVGAVREFCTIVLYVFQM
jgi:hypothetical protein